MGCVFVRDGIVVASGHNLTNKDMDATRHAELVAIDSMRQTSDTSHPFLKNCCLYVSYVDV